MYNDLFGVVMFFYVVFACVLLGFHIWGITRMMEIGRLKGYPDSGVTIFFLCFFLGVFGYLYVLALPDRRIKGQNEQIIALLSARQPSQAPGSVHPAALQHD